MGVGGASALGMLAHPGSVKATATEAAVAVATSVELASSVHFFSRPVSRREKITLVWGGYFLGINLKSLINRRTLDGG